MDLLVFLLVICAGTSAQAFILDSNCLTTAACRCFTNSILCNNTGLFNVPEFNITRGNNYNITVLDIRQNNITLVKNSAFMPLRQYVPTQLILDLSFNFIHLMENMCFEGLEDKIIGLSLDSNNLEAIPNSVANLPIIATLFMMYNPIKYLDPTILSKIGTTIVQVSFSLNNFITWPTEFHHLVKLVAMYTMGFNSTHIRQSDFRYIVKLSEFSILELSHSSLEEFPLSICSLPVLSFLNIANNTFIARTIDFFSDCENPMVNMRRLEMQSNSFDVLPNIGKTFPNIEILNFSNNNVRYITNELAPMSNLYDLSLDNNRLIHFPYILGTLAHNLQTLSMRNNVIVDIDNLVLAPLSRLQYLYLDGNPLEYIGSLSFIRLSSLLSVSLTSTKLSTVPCALSYVTSHHLNVDLSGNIMECSCTMKCLSSMNLSRVTFQNNPACKQSGHSIVQFITTVIQNNHCLAK